MNKGSAGVFSYVTEINGQNVTLQCLGSKNAIQIRRGGVDALYFDRTWNEYKNGFGENDKNLALGLETIHHLTSRHGLTDLEVIIFGSTYKFTNFVIDDEQVIDMIKP